MGRGRDLTTNGHHRMETTAGMGGGKHKKTASRMFDNMFLRVNVSEHMLDGMTCACVYHVMLVSCRVMSCRIMSCDIISYDDMPCQ